uniref:Velvet domain-containing protein n=1 Tax=Heterorhabditis bacteriophora TaxID=37862 RepID=A0A1I7XK31_HETBA
MPTLAYIYIYIYIYILRSFCAELLESPEESVPTIYENTTTGTPTKEQDDTQPTVTFALMVRDMAGSSGEDQTLKGSFDAGTFIEPPLSVRIMTRSSLPLL